MADDKKMPDAALIVSKMGPMSGGGDEKEQADEGKDAAAADLMDAIKRGDAAALKDALTAFYEMC